MIYIDSGWYPTAVSLVSELIEEDPHAAAPNKGCRPRVNNDGALSMANTKSPIRGGVHPPVGWCEEHVNDWIVARIKGQPWVPGPLPKFPTVIRKRELVRRVGLSHVRIWQLEREGKFPRRFPLTDRPGASDAAAD
jgi:predicted DNA-binding transcriptional regulator AlpA